jgi:hypothetical protein
LASAPLKRWATQFSADTMAHASFCSGAGERRKAASVDMESALVLLCDAFSTVNRIHFT